MDMNRLVRPVALAAIASALAVAVACGGSEPTATSVPPTATTAPTTAPTTAAPTATTKPAATATTAAPAATPTPGLVAGGVATATPTSAPVTGPGELPAPKSPQGTLTWAWSAVSAGPGLNSAQAPETMMSYGVSELFFRQSKSNPVEPWLATGWELAPDLSKVTIKFRDGVQFHKGYGELSAADVAWSLNDTNATTNPTSIHGQAGDYAPMFKEARAIDKNTLEIPLVTYDVRFASYFMNQAGDGFSIFSKKAFDEKGAEWMKANVVATGPFEVQQWTQNDRIILKGVAQHWDKAPTVKEIRIIHAPEAQSRVAMLLTGEADLAPLVTKDLIEVAKKGFTVAGTGRAWHVAIPMAGNYWEKTNANTGATLDTSGLFNNNLAWQGNPNNENDLNQSKLVRNALARAIDRQTIAKQAFADVAKPLYIGGFHATDPKWNDKWSYPYDPEGAKKMLDDAGFKAAANGKRFQMPVLGQTDNQLFFDVSEIVAGEWSKIGVDVAVLHYAYAVFRPTAVQRSNTTPIVMTCRENNGGAPWDWPRLSEYTSLTRGGFGCSMEIPFFLETYRKVAVEPDMAKRLELNNALAQYMWEQALEIGVVSVPDAVAYSSKAIKSWDMRPGIFLVVNSPENIVLAR